VSCSCATALPLTAACLCQALEAFPQAFGTPPDVIVLGVNLWDLARWKVCPLMCQACCSLQADASALQPVNSSMLVVDGQQQHPALAVLLDW
jgi:hypothetical protein